MYQLELAIHRDIKKELVRLLIAYMKGIIEDTWVDERENEGKELWYHPCSGGRLSPSKAMA